LNQKPVNPELRSCPGRSNPINRETLYERFLVTDQQKDDVGLSVTGQRLSQPDQLQSFLKDYAEAVGAEKSTTAASRFSYHMMRPMLRGPFYLLAYANGRFPFGLDRVTYQEHTDAETGHEWGLNVDALTIETNDPSSRDNLRDDTIRDLIDHHYGAIFGSLSDVTGIGTRTLWENLAHVLGLYYPRWIEESSDPAASDNLKSDLKRLHDQRILGKTNPLAEPLKSYSLLDRDDNRFERTTCCLNYRIEEYCERCPLPDSK
jgi:ferric iron reductase protein FhuF